MTHEGHGTGPSPLELTSRETPTERDVRAKDLEVVTTHEQSRHAFGFAAVQRELPDFCVRTDFVKGAILSLVLEKLRIREHVNVAMHLSIECAVKRLVDRDDAVAVRDGKGTERHLIEDGEDRSIEAEAQPQRQHDGDRES